MVRKPKGSHRAYKEWAPELYMQKSMAELQ